MTTAAPTPLIEDLNEFFAGRNADARRDPYALYTRMRCEAPVLQYDERMFLVTRYADVKAARLSPCIQSPNERLGQVEGRFDRLGADDLEAYTEITDFERLMLSRHDGAPHKRYRTALVRAFTPRRMAEWPDRVQAIVDAELDAVVADGTIDLLTFAYRVPLLVIMALLGAPPQDADLIKRWGDELIEAIMLFPLDPGLLQRGRRGLREYRSYTRELIERHRQGGGDRTSVVALLLDAEADEALPTENIVATFMHFLFAGHETTTNLVASGTLSLLKNRDQWDLLCSDPEAYGAGAVEESLRYESPSQMSIRQTIEEVDVGGVTIPADVSLMLVQGSANRDPEAFPDPDRFDITRTPNDHLALGWGAHFCLGAPLARMEGRIALQTLARRFPASSSRSTRPSSTGLGGPGCADCMGYR